MGGMEHRLVACVPSRFVTCCRSGPGVPSANETGNMPVWRTDKMSMFRFIRVIRGSLLFLAGCDKLLADGR
jgi:hypothetical protein